MEVELRNHIKYFSWKHVADGVIRGYPYQQFIKYVISRHYCLSTTIHVSEPILLQSYRCILRSYAQSYNIYECMCTTASRATPFIKARYNTSQTAAYM